MQELRSGSDHRDLDVLYLETVNRARKYSFVFDMITTLLFNDHDLIYAVGWLDFLTILKSMMMHKSQLVWFRWIYVFTSRYMLINNLKIIPVS